MPRQSLRGISGNSNYTDGAIDRFELTSHWHSHIIDRAAGGQYLKIIIDDLNIHSFIIKIILCQANSRYKNESQH